MERFTFIEYQMMYLAQTWHYPVSPPNGPETIEIPRYNFIFKDVPLAAHAWQSPPGLQPTLPEANGHESASKRTTQFFDIGDTQYVGAWVPIFDASEVRETGM